MVFVAAVLAVSLIAGLVALSAARRSAARMERRMAAAQAQFDVLAHEDPLTGLPNRRAFDDRLDGELRRAAREYYPVAVVVLGLDRLGDIKDTGGEAAADEALKKLAEHLQADLRGGDGLARIEGDRFALALARADAHAAERVLGRLRTAMKGVTVGPAAQHLGFSAGIAEFPRDATLAPKVLECASTAHEWARANAPGRAAVYPPGAARSVPAPGKDAEAEHQRSLLSTLLEAARTVDAKNRFTIGHAERVASYAVTLAASFDFTQDRLDALRQAALLHDVGKIGIRETILSKESPLNMEELEELERHSELGRAMLSGAGLPELARWVNHIHERFDGAGYPYGLAGAKIPLESRILHVADALDQLTRPSPVRRYRPLREALAELSYCSGSRVDPAIAGRAIELVQSGELKLDGHDQRPLARRALSVPRERRVS